MTMIEKIDNTTKKKVKNKKKNFHKFYFFFSFAINMKRMYISHHIKIAQYQLHCFHSFLIVVIL